MWHHRTASDCAARQVQKTHVLRPFAGQLRRPRDAPGWALKPFAVAVGPDPESQPDLPDMVAVGRAQREVEESERLCRPAAADVRGDERRGQKIGGAGAASPALTSREPSR